MLGWAFTLTEFGVPDSGSVKGCEMDATSDEANKGAVVVDTSRAERPVWLLKMPPAVSKSWQQQQQSDHPSGLTFAKVLLTLDPTKSDTESAMQFRMELTSKEAASIPKTYELNVTKDFVPMCVFSETPQGKLALEGKVEHKFDMKPTTLGNEEYRQLCRARLNKAMTKTRTTQVLVNDNGDLMRPSPLAAWSVSAKRKASVPKAQEVKRIRIERADLEDMLFKLFEGQPHWALKQLLVKTEQPEAFLKEVLSDLCMYNKRGPNQGKYELKPEYKRTPTEENAGT